VSALVLTIECSGGPSEFLGIPCDPTPPQHDRCPGSHTTPGLLGGWHCSCSCHPSSAPVLAPDCPGGAVTANDPNDAIQSLARLTAAAARLMARMHYAGKPIDTASPPLSVLLGCYQARTTSW
jgi:hypothetical protein